MEHVVTTRLGSGMIERLDRLAKSRGFGIKRAAVVRECVDRGLKELEIEEISELSNIEEYLERSANELYGLEAGKPLSELSMLCELIERRPSGFPPTIEASLLAVLSNRPKSQRAWQRPETIGDEQRYALGVALVDALRTVCHAGDYYA